VTFRNRHTALPPSSLHVHVGLSAIVCARTPANGMGALACTRPDLSSMGTRDVVCGGCVAADGALCIALSKRCVHRVSWARWQRCCKCFTVVVVNCAPEIAKTAWHTPCCLCAHTPLLERCDYRVVAALFIIDIRSIRVAPHDACVWGRDGQPGSEQQPA
jgi:hypothetical protein